VFSILFIYGCQYLWNILKDSYSKKKTKDLVNMQIKKYKKMIDEIQCSQNAKSTYKDKIDKNEINKMDIELSDFIMNEL